LQAHQNAAVICALIAVVKQADVPAGAHQVQKFEQSTRALGKHKAHEAFVLRQAGVTAHHVTNVLFGQIIVRQIQVFKAMLFEVVGDLGALAGAFCGEAHKHMRLGGIADAVVKFCDIARAAWQVANEL